MIRSRAALGAAAVLAAAVAAHAQKPRAPIIDMHLHAVAATSQGPPPLGLCAPLDLLHDPATAWRDAFLARLKKPSCADPIWSPETDDELMQQTVEVLRRNNIVAVASGPADYVRRWREVERDRLIPGLIFSVGPKAPSPDALRTMHRDGQLAVLGEVTNQYAGIAPDDPAFEPYLAMAEELDIPVGIHIGTGPPGAPYLGFRNYRARMHSPLLLEEPLLRHPKLRVYIMHAGWPMIDDLLAVLWTHPQVYVDVAVIDVALPRAEFHRYLQRIVDAGFGKRVMFGSDQMVWPGMIERGIAAIDASPSLSANQKRDILYNNAARFLRFSEAEIAKHHRQ